jgi:hypothetical protein
VRNASSAHLRRRPAPSPAAAGLQARDGGVLGLGGRHPSELSMNRTAPSQSTLLRTSLTFRRLDRLGKSALRRIRLHRRGALSLVTAELAFPWRALLFPSAVDISYREPCFRAARLAFAWRRLFFRCGPCIRAARLTGSPRSLHSRGAPLHRRRAASLAFADVTAPPGSRHRLPAAYFPPSDRARDRRIRPPSLNSYRWGLFFDTPDEL